MCFDHHFAQSLCICQSLRGALGHSRHSWARQFVRRDSLVKESGKWLMGYWWDAHVPRCQSCPHTMAHRRSDGPSDLKNWWGHLNRVNKFISRYTHGHTRKHRVNTLNLFLWRCSVIMVYIKRWGEFKAQSLDLCKRRPSKARLVLKARPKTQLLTVKVTDSSISLNFRSKSSIILNRLDEFQRDMFVVMSGITPTSPKQESSGAHATEMHEETTTSKPTTQTSHAKSGKKKKNKKK